MTVYFKDMAQMEKLLGINDSNLAYLEFLYGGELHSKGNRLSGSRDQTRFPAFVERLQRLRVEIHLDGAAVRVQTADQRSECYGSPGDHEHVPDRILGHPQERGKALGKAFRRAGSGRGADHSTGDRDPATVALYATLRKHAGRFRGTGTAEVFCTADHTDPGKFLF